MTYLYLPNYDGDMGPVWEESEARSELDSDDLVDAKPAELVVMREGSRGHYLAACYLEDAADIVEHDQEQTEVARESDWRNKVAAWRRVAASYNEHGGANCPGAEPIEVNGTMVPGLCSDCEWIHDDADAAESELGDRGYVTWWDDGFTIHKVDDDGN